MGESGDSHLAVNSAGELEEPKSMFSPPLYYQRYSAVEDIIQHHQAEYGDDIQSLLDIGCAECSFIKRARHLTFLTEITGLDVDEELLLRSSAYLKPLLSDYLPKRRDDLTLTVIAGSIAERDESVRHCDVVTAIEVIEHLYPPVLDDMVKTVFGFINPLLVVVTTPNSEYNILFPNFTGMRHWDHKFEWSRDEFKQWVDSICTTYHYSAEFWGVGDPPEGREDVGFCSQLAVFKRIGGQTHIYDLPETTKYTKVHSVVFPGHHRTEREESRSEVEYALNTFMYRCLDDDSDGGTVLLAVEEIRLSSYKLSEGFTTAEVCDILRELGYSVTDDNRLVTATRKCQTDSSSDCDSDPPLQDATVKTPDTEELWD